MQIEIFSGFSKRHNSTKRPAAAGTAVNILVKDGADIKTPTLELNTLDFTINYVKAFDQYYFAHVQNIDGHRCNLLCDLDHLATFKPQIGAYTGYVEYASAAPGGLLYLDDPRNGPTSLVDTFGASVDPGWTASSSGAYLIGMANAVSIGNCGAPAYYCTDATGISDIVSKMFDQNIVPTIRNQFNGVFDAIVSCIWLPFTPGWITSNIGNVSMPVYAGYQDLGIGNFAMLTGRIWNKRVYLSIPAGPAGYGGTYIQSNKYNTTTIYLPGVGVVPINYDIYKDAPAGIAIDIHLDIITGDIVYYLSTSGPGSVGENQCFSGNIAAKVPVVGSSYDGIGVASGILSTASNMAHGDALGSAQGILGIAKSLSVDNIVIGGNSSPLAFAQDSNIRIENHRIVPIHGATSAAELEVFRAEQGMPFFNNAQLSSLPGYIKCRAASVAIPGDGTEQDVVNGYLNSGFYYE